MSFDALQARINASTLKRFGAPVLLAGVPVQARFDQVYALGKVGDSGMASNAPSLLLLDSAMPLNPIGAAVVVTDPKTLIATNYTVASPEPDGTGMTRLWLEAA